MVLIDLAAPRPKMPVVSVDHALMPLRSVGPATGTTEINPEEGVKASVGTQTAAQTGVLTDQEETDEEAAAGHPGPAEVPETTTTTIKEEGLEMTGMVTRRGTSQTTTLETKEGTATATDEERSSRLM